VHVVEGAAHLPGLERPGVLAGLVADAAGL
jgi:hypothetical protein